MVCASHILTRLHERQDRLWPRRPGVARLAASGVAVAGAVIWPVKAFSLYTGAAVGTDDEQHMWCFDVRTVRRLWWLQTLALKCLCGCPDLGDIVQTGQ